MKTKVIKYISLVFMVLTEEIVISKKEFALSYNFNFVHDFVIAE